MCLIVNFCSYNPESEFTSDEASITGGLIIDEENAKAAKVSEKSLGPPLLTSTQQTQKSPEIQKSPETEKSHQTQKPAIWGIVVFAYVYRFPFMLVDFHVCSSLACKK